MEEEFVDGFQILTKESIVPITHENIDEEKDEPILVESLPEDILNSFRDLLKAEKETEQEKGFWAVINKKELLDDICFVSQLYVLYRDECFDCITDGSDIKSFARYLSIEGENIKNVKEAKSLVARLTQNISDGVQMVDEPTSSSTASSPSQPISLRKSVKRDNSSSLHLI